MKSHHYASAVEGGNVKEKWNHSDKGRHSGAKSNGLALFALSPAYNQ
jgi:hypothetical protein